jgi:hypothetical protein
MMPAQRRRLSHGSSWVAEQGNKEAPILAVEERFTTFCTVMMHVAVHVLGV